MEQLSLDFSKPARLPPTVGQQRLAYVIKVLNAPPIIDVLASGEEIRFVATNHQLTMYAHDKPYRMLTHSIGQICQRLRIAKNYVVSLMSENRDTNHWAETLLERNLNDLMMYRGGGKTFLLRTVGTTVPGVLSTAYKRLNSVTLIEEFAAFAATVGAEPFNAYISPVKVAVEAALPDTWNVRGVPTKVGVVLRNSDFGAGAEEVGFFVHAYGRSIICKNRLKNWHRGRRLSRDEVRNERILQEDNQRVVEEMKQHIFRHLEPSNIQAAMTEMELAADTVIDVDKVSEILEILDLDAEELERAVTAFKATRTDLPPGYTLFRLANTVAWLAETEPDVDRKLELMERAGALLTKGS